MAAPHAIPCERFVSLRPTPLGGRNKRANVLSQDTKAHVSGRHECKIEACSFPLLNATRPRYRWRRQRAREEDGQQYETTPSGKKQGPALVGTIVNLPLLETLVLYHRVEDFARKRQNR